MALGASGHYGEQFAVDGFQRRSFTYLEIGGIRLSATNYVNSTGGLEQDLVKNKWITSTGKKPKSSEWITVSHMAVGELYQSDADILVKYLDMSKHPGTTLDLARWGVYNPGYASVMWPEIQIVAQGNMYILVPDIIHHMLDLSEKSNNPFPQPDLKDVDDSSSSTSKSDPLAKMDKNQIDRATAQQVKQGKPSLDSFLTNLFLKAGKAAQDAGEVKRARFCFEQVLRLSPASQEAQEHLDELPPAPAEEKPVEEENSKEYSSEEETES
ncbi:hypothetical protein GC197_13360 [bacterium]|nr:hypothetical protein [bacterium]